ncbi:MAG TPA: NlpC/P60 family protein [Kineosporiaceae bacterium]|nr:NlpC/P60 family protein [Kineosporiaceae bacterium]
MRKLTPAVKALIAVGVVFGIAMAGLITVPLLMVMGTTAVSTEDTTDGSSSCGPVAVVAGTNITLDDDQLANARTIVQTGQSLKVPDRGLVVAIATALQESTLQNLGWGDRDSVGLFQQRAGWGSTAERTDPATSASMFYTGGRAGQSGLLDIAGWATMSITRAAQAVQVSAYPMAYAKWETLAASLVESVIGNDPLACSDALGVGLPTGAVGEMLRVALAQQGKPYVFGAVGPDSFDCSGIVVYAWRLAGYRVTVRTAAQMWNVSTPVARGSEKPGDLLFGEFDQRVPGAGHVMIVVKPGLAVQAPSTGRNVQLTRYSSFNSSWRLARFKPSALVPIAKAA